MKRILIIDDDERICDVVKRGLEGMSDFQVSVAYNGKDGIKSARRLKPDLILLDIRMPEMNGMEVLKILKEGDDTMEIPIFMLSAVHEDSAKIKCNSEYADIYIEKPIPLVFLKEKIEQVLKLRGKT